MAKLARLKAAMVLFPGSNCEQETLALMTWAYGKADVIWHKDRFDPQTYDLVVLPGGFSYGDYVRAGACAVRSPAMQDVTRMAKLGRFVIGICNGFQILLEARLLPGVLVENTLRRFDCRWVSLKGHSPCRLKWSTPASITLPIANTFGRYMAKACRDPIAPDQIVLTYANNDRCGSEDAIAGLTNQEGNVLGLMPHPERAFAPHHAFHDGCMLFPGTI